MTRPPPVSSPMSIVSAARSLRRNTTIGVLGWTSVSTQRYTTYDRLFSVDGAERVVNLTRMEVSTDMLI